MRRRSGERKTHAEEGEEVSDAEGGRKRQIATAAGAEKKLGM